MKTVEHGLSTSNSYERGMILNACVGTPIKSHNTNIFSDIREKKLDEPNTLCQGANQIDIHKMTKRDD